MQTLTPQGRLRLTEAGQMAQGHHAVVTQLREGPKPRLEGDEGVGPSDAGAAV